MRLPRWLRRRAAQDPAPPAAEGAFVHAPDADSVDVAAPPPRALAPADVPDRLVVGVPSGERAPRAVVGMPVSEVLYGAGGAQDPGPGDTGGAGCADGG